MSGIDYETQETVETLQQWLRDLDRVIEGTAVQSGPSCSCCENDSDPIGDLLYKDAPMFDKLRDVHVWATRTRHVVKNAMWQTIRMDVEHPTFYGGCSLDHENVGCRVPEASLDRLFEGWCVWIGGFWIGERADAYWHNGSFGYPAQLVLRTADTVMRFNMNRESFQEYYYPEGKKAQTIVFSEESEPCDLERNVLVPKYPELAVRLAEALAKTSQRSPDWEIEDFREAWSGYRIAKVDWH